MTVISERRKRGAVEKGEAGIPDETAEREKQGKDWDAATKNDRDYSSTETKRLWVRTEGKRG